MAIASVGQLIQQPQKMASRKKKTTKLKCIACSKDMTLSYDPENVTDRTIGKGGRMSLRICVA